MLNRRKLSTESWFDLIIQKRLLICKNTAITRMLQAQNLSIKNRQIDKIARIATNHQYKPRTMVKWHKSWCSVKDWKSKHWTPNLNTLGHKCIDACNWNHQSNSIRTEMINILMEISGNFVDFESHTTANKLRIKLKALFNSDSASA